ncbi:MAG: class I SAM-dependent methyltransferase [Bacteroidota bacterium]
MKAFLEKFPGNGGVYCLSKPDNSFEDSYIAIRKKEQRVLSDEQVSQLPRVDRSNPHFDEWQIRNRSFERVINYLMDDPKSQLRILDLGCGNGWFTHRLAALGHLEVLGLDINMIELKQAARIFTTEKCRFAYGDIAVLDFDNLKFDRIFLNASVQYFSNLTRLLKRLLNLLNKGGEIHIIDSPFYKSVDIPAAKARSFSYYKTMGFETMSTSYFHHSLEEISQFDPFYLYQPSTGFKKFLDRFGKKDTPFPWIRISKEN